MGVPSLSGVLLNLTLFVPLFFGVLSLIGDTAIDLPKLSSSSSKFLDCKKLKILSSVSKSESFKNKLIRFAYKSY
jgi:hypothetical protein